MKRAGWLAIGLLSVALLVGAGRAEALPQGGASCSGAAAPAPSSLAGTREQRDGTFLEAQAGPAQACLTSGSLKTAAPRASCINLFCQTEFDCSSCPGGLTAWYCAIDVHRCVPF